MNITCAITDGMTAKEKAIYFEQMEKNHRYEADKVRQMKEETRSYKQMLIDDIMQLTDRFTKEELAKRSISTLERIYDYC